ncbi:hypothetical protein EVJ32_04870 [Exiguobacterium sp. SH5S4]|uniref:hypothetical protein n=1 Tax=Exiguobacterium sp. SH5S4 TaxID=2510961 RepID=UPI00103E7604|nr:hypothetical protein [Exiguobacterium sp. SH5S4]TCI26709.1 hypothetical protein EVJ32_04870 [Exiguobacterium sp. SH5S4]
MELTVIYIILAVLIIGLSVGILVGRSVFPKKEQYYVVDEPPAQERTEADRSKDEFREEMNRRKNRVKNLGVYMARFMQAIDSYDLSTNGREFEALGYTNMFINHGHSDSFATYIYKNKQKEMDELLNDHFCNFSSWSFSKKVFEEKAEIIIDLAKSIVDGYAAYSEEKMKSKIKEVKNEVV